MQTRKRKHAPDTHTLKLLPENSLLVVKILLHILKFTIYFDK